MNLLGKARKTFARVLTPSRLLILSFALLIAAGAVLLMLPAAAGGRPLTLVDALFTSASAVCVTGLAVVDIGRDLSVFGQIVTLILFQVGGLGIITFSVVIFGMIGRGISYREREIVQSTFLTLPRRDIVPVIIRVLHWTFVAEALGTVLLFCRFSQDFPPGKALYLAVYHAVSAFNNCGYGLFSDSLVSYRGDWLVNLTVMGLIVLGGIGFIVQQEVADLWQGCRKRLSLHSKIVLIATGLLILGGAVLFYLFEHNNVLAAEPWSTRVLISLFQSVTARTAGFNTVDMGGLTNAAILLLIVLMFIGASPGSTGGGIKTTSFTILLLIILNRMRGSNRVSVMNRQIPREILGRTLAIVFAAAFSVFIITAFLLVFAGGGTAPPQDSRHLFVEYLFETVSAFGTVGLSMGATTKLTDLQKLAVIFMMFAGRVGPLTLAFAWYRTERKDLELAEEPLMVG